MPGSHVPSTWHRSFIRVTTQTCHTRVISKSQHQDRTWPVEQQDFTAQLYKHPLAMVTFPPVTLTTQICPSRLFVLISCDASLRVAATRHSCLHARVLAATHSWSSHVCQWPHITCYLHGSHLPMVQPCLSPRTSLNVTTCCLCAAPSVQDLRPLTYDGFTPLPPLCPRLAELRNKLIYNVIHSCEWPAVAGKQAPVTGWTLRPTLCPYQCGATDRPAPSLPAPTHITTVWHVCEAGLVADSVGWQVHGTRQRRGGACSVPLSSTPVCPSRPSRDCNNNNTPVLTHLETTHYFW